MRFVSRRTLANNSHAGSSVGSGNQHEIKTHSLAEFTQLVFYGSAGSLVVRISQKQHHSGFEGGVFSCNFQKPAVLQVALGMNACNRYLAFTKRRVQAVPYRRLHETLNHPEAAA